ncbi:MAG: hypothetical protein RBS43_03620 [Candidatus Cloacimonas sp.]|nr:hypothetical protein [Candidatus Cloacimonas sp.]
MLKSGYVQSAIVHILLLLLLAVIFIKPVLPLKWHSFEWELPQRVATERAPAAKGVTPVPAVAEADKPALAPSVVSVAPTVNPAPATEQRIIETPVMETPADAISPASRPRTSRERSDSGLRDLGKNLPGGNFGFSTSMEQGSGEAYIIAQSKPNIQPTEEGEVFLEFRLTSRGEVDMGSVVVISYSTASYVEAVQKALRTWRFGFRGTYNPERKYRIRCNFVINEN